jgi:predicted nucleotidyltransferase
MADTTHIQQPMALAFATRCAQILRDRFRARRVIPFGSVVGHGTWHSGSDLALAVEGIPPEQFFQAWAALRELLPPGLDVDLVDLEVDQASSFSCRYVHNRRCTRAADSILRGPAS